MAKRIIEMNFWNDGLVLEKFTPEDKYFMLYLMTNPDSNVIGIYVLIKKKTAFVMGYSPDSIDSLLKRFQELHKRVVYDESTQEIAVLNTLKYSISKGGKPMEDVIQRSLEGVKSDRLVAIVYQSMSEWWSKSARPFDQTVMKLFEQDLERRGVKASRLKENPSNLLNDNDNEYVYIYGDSGTESKPESEPDSDIELKDLKREGIPYTEIIDYLNKKAGRRFNVKTSSHRRLIRARFNEGFTLEDFKTVIDKKVNDWGDDGEMQKYLRPETLFGSKFDGYLNQSSIPKKTNFELENRFLNAEQKNGWLDEAIDRSRKRSLRGDA